jgi:pyridoxamine 5'-phosphate oxidase
MSDLREEDVGAEPMAEVDRWIAEATDAGVPEPTAMQVATRSADGQPSVRSVLLRGWDERGFRFFTDLRSRKASDLAADQRCGLVLFWHRPLLRQILVTGAAAQLDRDAVRAYWMTRRRESRIAAWASTQSGVLPDRAALDDAYAEYERRFEGVDVPLPDHWGGYLVVPSTVELWQGQDARMHDRLRWRRLGDAWARERLAP